MDHAVGIFETAKAKNDTATMDRAMSYANDALAEAQKEITDISNDLKKAVDDHSAEQKKKEEDALKDLKEKVDSEDIVEISFNSCGSEEINVSFLENIANSEFNFQEPIESADSNHIDTAVGKNIDILA